MRTSKIIYIEPLFGVTGDTLIEVSRASLIADPVKCLFRVFVTEYLLEIDI